MTRNLFRASEMTSLLANIRLNELMIAERLDGQNGRTCCRLGGGVARRELVTFQTSVTHRWVDLQG